MDFIELENLMSGPEEEHNKGLTRLSINDVSSSNSNDSKGNPWDKRGTRVEKCWI